MAEDDGSGALVGGVEGMLLAGGFTDVSGVIVLDGMADDGMVEVGAGMADMSVDGVVVVAIGAVAEVSAEVPVAAEPAHQSLLVRALGEAFI